MTGDVFPLGETIVTCDLRFEHMATGATEWLPPVALDWATSSPEDLDPWYLYPSGKLISGLSPALAPAVAHGATLADVTSRDVDEYKYRALFFPTDAGIYTSSTAAFTVTVSAAPELSGSLGNALVGSAYSDSIVAAAYPAPTFSIDSGTLPAGLTLSSSGQLQGTPAAGSAGRYDVTVKATNEEGSATLAQTLWVVDPVVELEHGSIVRANDPVAVDGEGFTPGGDVEVWLHSTPKLVATVVADSDGRVHTQVSTGELGTHHVELVDVASSAIARSADFTVSADGLAHTGTEAVLGFAAAALLLSAGAFALLRRRKVDAHD